MTLSDKIQAAPNAIKYVLSEEGRAKITQLRENLGDLPGEVEDCFNTLLEEAKESLDILNEILREAFRSDLTIETPPQRRHLIRRELRQKVEREIEKRTEIVAYIPR